MKAVGLTQFGGPEALEIIDVPAPEPGPGEIRIRVQALLLNAVTAQLALDAFSPPVGATLAVLGAASAVGGYLVELAKDQKMPVIATASANDEAFLHSLGADAVVDRDEDFTARIREVVPGGVVALADCAALDAAALPPTADGGALATFRGWSGPTERGIRDPPDLIVCGRREHRATRPPGTASRGRRVCRCGSRRYCPRAGSRGTRGLGSRRRPRTDSPVLLLSIVEAPRKRDNP